MTNKARQSNRLSLTGSRRGSWASTLDPRIMRTIADDIEDQGDLDAIQTSKGLLKKDAMPDPLQGYKNSSRILFWSAIFDMKRPFSPPLESSQDLHDRQRRQGQGSEPVYRRSDVVVCKTVEIWHKEGHLNSLGEQPLKLVPIRAVTLMRKLEVEQAVSSRRERSLSRGSTLASRRIGSFRRQSKDGVIPKNSYGNIDIYVPSMVPAGAEVVMSRCRTRCVFARSWASTTPRPARDLSLGIRWQYRSS